MAERVAPDIQGMNRYVADTHALFWYLTASPRLSPKAKDAFDEGARGEAIICTGELVSYMSPSSAVPSSKKIRVRPSGVR